MFGFFDADSSFGVQVCRGEKYKTGWNIKVEFSNHLHSKDVHLLHSIQSFFGVGKVYINPGGCGCSQEKLRVSSVKDLINVIIPFFI